MLDVRGGVAQQRHRDILDSRGYLDVNNDGVVNIFDLVSVADHFEQTGPSIRADVNSDGVVDIYDLVLVASGIGGGSGAAPAAEHHDLDSRHTREQIQKWLIQAQELAPTDAVSQRVYIPIML